ISLANKGLNTSFSGGANELMNSTVLARESRNGPQCDHRSEMFFPRLRNIPPARCLARTNAPGSMGSLSFPRARKQPRAPDGLSRAPRFSAVSAIKYNNFSQQIRAELMFQQALTEKAIPDTLAISVLLSQQAAENSLGT